jgi:hypothetical protein
MTMNVTELALALYAADLPDSRLTMPEVLTLAHEGIERLGGVESVHERAQKLRDFNLLLLDEQIDRRQHEKLMREHWPDRRRLDRCLDYAHPIVLTPGSWCVPEATCV